MGKVEWIEPRRIILTPPGSVIRALGEQARGPDYGTDRDRLEPSKWETHGWSDSGSGCQLLAGIYSEETIMKLRKVGFFRELRHGNNDGPSLTDHISDVAQPRETDIVNYLRKGILLVACPGISRDVLDESAEIIGSPHIMTDGVWEWPNDLSYYVEKYHARVPESFVQHMQSHDWKVPEERTVDLGALDRD